MNLIPIIIATFMYLFKIWVYLKFFSKSVMCVHKINNFSQISQTVAQFLKKIV